MKILCTLKVAEMVKELVFDNLILVANLNQDHEITSK